MSQSTLAAPQLVINSRMIYSSWIPADPKAAAALLPSRFRPADNHAIYMNQYVVDSEEQTYLTQLDSRIMAGNYAYIGELVDPFELRSVEFLAKDHPLWAIRPAQPFQPVAASSWFAPRDSFVYPGGEYEI